MLAPLLNEPDEAAARATADPGLLRPCGSGKHRT